jgi:hypothetical protein
MRLRPLAIVLATAVCLVGTLIGPTAARVPLAIVLIAILPGAVLADALFAHFADPAEQLLVTLALSVVVVVLGGFALDATVGITRHSVSYLVAAVTVTAALVRLVAQPRGELPLRPRVHVSPRDIGLLALATILVVAAVAYARTPLHARGAQGYTALWIDPTAGSLQLGVESQELGAMRYRLVVETGSGGIMFWQIALAPGGKWTTTLARPRKQKIEAILYRQRGRTWIAYRHVHTVA